MESLGPRIEQHTADASPTTSEEKKEEEKGDDDDDEDKDEDDDEDDDEQEEGKKGVDEGVDSEQDEGSPSDQITLRASSKRLRSLSNACLHMSLLSPSNAGIQQLKIRHLVLLSCPLFKGNLC